MSRLDSYKPSYSTEYDNGINSIVKDRSKKEEKVLIVDFDSIAYSQCIPKVEEKRGPYELDEVDTIIIPKIKEKLYALQEDIKIHFNIKAIYCFIGGANSYRKKLFPEYKSNRLSPPIVLSTVYAKCVEELNVIRAREGFEADDELYVLGNKYKDVAILAYVDKDLKQISGINYNYNKYTWEYINEEQARFSLAMQMCTGDRGDFVIVNKGCGEKKAMTFIKQGMTNYQYIKGIINCYRNYNPTSEDIKLIIKRTYKLLSLGVKYNK